MSVKPVQCLVDEARVMPGGQSSKPLACVCVWIRQPDSQRKAFCCVLSWLNGLGLEEDGLRRPCAPTSGCTLLGVLTLGPCAHKGMHGVRQVNRESPNATPAGLVLCRGCATKVLQ